MAYKAVFILGPNLEVGATLLAATSTLYSQPDYLMIGDGSKGITYNDLTSLKDKIDSNTRIDILAHGGDYSGHHTISLKTSSSIYTKEFFALLIELNNHQPLYLHLWSCFGGLANQYIKSLPQQSILVTHAPTNYATSLYLNSYSFMQEITTLQKQTSHLSPWQSFSDNLSFESIQIETIITWDKDKEYKFEVKPKLLEVLSNPTNSLQKIATDYQEFYNQLPFDTLPELKSFAPEQQQATNFKHAYFIHSCGFSEQEDLIYTLESNKVDKLLLETSVNSDTCLLEASANNKLQLVSFLLAHKVDPNQARNNGATSLFMAAQEGLKDIAELLLKYKADPNQANNDGGTPLLMAAQKGHKDIVELLLKYGADPNQANNDDGTTPLSMAAQKGHKDIVELLLKYKADPNQANSKGDTPLIIAAQEGHKDIVELLLKHKANPNQDNNNGTTPLSMAAQEGHKDVAELLLKYGANPNQARNDGVTSLFMAAHKGLKDIVELLLKYGADPKQARNDGVAPLLMAAQNGNKDVAELLLKCGADPTREYQGLNAIKIAKIKKFDDLAILLADVASGKIKYSPSDCPSFSYNTTTEVAMIGDSNDHNEL